jgi:uncharacterized protein YjeT (DUF2065 family)
MTRPRLQRILGAVLVAVGCAVLVVDVGTFDAVVLSVTKAHGLHLSDLVGGAMVVVGVGVLWTAPARRRG